MDCMKIKSILTVFNVCIISMLEKGMFVFHYTMFLDITVALVILKLVPLGAIG